MGAHGRQNVNEIKSPFVFRWPTSEDRAEEAITKTNRRRKTSVSALFEQIACLVSPSSILPWQLSVHEHNLVLLILRVDDIVVLAETKI